MVQNFQQRLCTEQAITTGTSYSTDQYGLAAIATKKGPYGLAIPTGSRDIGIGQPLYVRCRVTEAFDQVATTLSVCPMIGAGTDMSVAESIEMCRVNLLGALLAVGATWHIPLRPISMAEAIDVAGATLAPTWPLALGYIGCKFIVTGTAFSTGKVTVDITDHVAPEAHLNILGAKIFDRTPLAGW